MIILIIPIGGIHLHLHQNNLTYHSTSKNITRKIFNQKRIQKENYNLKGKIKNTTNHQITIKIKNTKSFTKHNMRVNI